MKKLVVLLLSMSSFYSLAAIKTKLTAKAEPTNRSIIKAVASLHKALAGDSKNFNLEKARALLAKTDNKITFHAAIYVNGNKQFNNRGDYTQSYNFSVYCYKGEVQEAVALINKALELSFWDGDEEWIEKASENGEKIDLLIQDGPNEFNWTVTFGACQ